MDASAQSRGSSEREKELERRVESLQKQLERALAENERLRKQLEEALRANQRRSAPFSKGEPKANPKPPGRKPGTAYGQRATRPCPAGWMSRSTCHFPRAASSVKV
jgi:hypothetical protein